MVHVEILYLYSEGKGVYERVLRLDRTGPSECWLHKIRNLTRWYGTSQLLIVKIYDFIKRIH